MSLFWTIVAVLGVLAVLAASHLIAWMRGFDSGKVSAGFDALEEKMKALRGGK